MKIAIENSNIELTSDYVKTKLLQLDAEAEDEKRRETALTAEHNKQGKSSSQRKGKKTFQEKFKVEGLQCYNCKGPHKARFCPRKEKEKSSKKNDKQVGLLSALSANVQRTDWYIDSASTKHMTNDKSCFVNCKKQTGLEIKCADDQTLLSEGVGDAKVKFKDVTTPVDIKDVIYVPKLSANLLSVSTLVERGLAVVFTDKGGAIYKKDKLKITGVPMLTATQENGMYKLHHDDEKAFKVITKNEQELWLRRLGHLGLSNMKLLRDGMVTGIKSQEQCILCCESCLMGGQTKQPFNKKGGTRAKEILELVHSDVCGPMSEKSSGYRYFLTFIDDKTRKTFVYFLKSKDEVVCKFKEFTALVERQTGKKLKTLRSDNGREYVLLLKPNRRSGPSLDR